MSHFVLYRELHRGGLCRIVHDDPKSQFTQSLLYLAGNVESCASSFQTLYLSPGVS